MSEIIDGNLYDLKFEAGHSSFMTSSEMVEAIYKLNSLPVPDGSATEHLFKSALTYALGIKSPSEKP